jgi:hypothetical protein
MKKISLIIVAILFLMSCKSTEMSNFTSTIIGKWLPTYLTQRRNPDGSWEEWKRIQTFVPLPTYEFTSDGRFLRDGKDGADCCTSGSKYSITNSIITFTERQTCPTVRCIACDNWTVIEIKNDTLILEECATVRSKFVKQK